MEIKYFNRGAKEMEVEKVYGDKAVRWLYESLSGKVASTFVTMPFVSKAYGMMQSSGLSKKKVAPFIDAFKIKIEEYLPEEGRTKEDPYSSFNEFFIRRFKDGAREFVKDCHILPAFSEARYFGYDRVTDDQVIPVKGKFLSSKELLRNEKWNSTFENGPLLLARLCPVDYHRYHYPDNGTTLDHYRIKGELHSVNPIALKKKPDIFVENERVVTILETENFGKLAYIEVGATCVGKIIQSHQDKDFQRGDEKGYFLFGGSTVIVLGEAGKWKPSSDILEYTQQGIETYLKLGEESGLKL
ncbi:phosphatidylserine decarboxylase [Bacteriovoracaceae bacterium]|nr:phosphatidylserine decarboxylase [Bacteriovoracaceae bacterium]